MSTVRIQLRRGTVSEWSTTNPILAAGEIGFETNTNKIKVGDGTTHWNSLDYITAEADTANLGGQIASDIAAAIQTAEDYTDTSIAALTTSDIEEGSNHYFTERRTTDAVNAHLTTGPGINTIYTNGNLEIYGKVVGHGNINTSVNEQTNDIVINLNNSIDISGDFTSDTVTTGEITATDISGTSLTLTGDLHIGGTTTTTNTSTLNVSDPMIYMAENNTSNNVDLGIVASFTKSGTYQHTGLVRDAIADTWKLFKGVTDEPTTTINFTQASYDSLTLGHLESSSINATSANIGDVSNTELQYLNGVNAAIQTQLNEKAPLNGATFTGSITLPANTITESNIQNSQVTTSKIADAAVTEAKIASGTIVDANISSTASINISKISGLQTVLDDKASVANVNLKAPINNPHFTGTVVMPSATAIGDVTPTEIAYVHGVTSAIQTQLDAAQTSLASKASTSTVSSHTSATTNVHGILDTSKLVATTDTGTVATDMIANSAITSAKIADGTIVNADINASAAIALSKLATDPLARANHTGTQTASTISDFNEAAQDAVGGILGSGLTYTDSSNTITVDSSVIQLRVSGVSDTEIGYLDGVTSAIQTQINSKLASSTASSTYAPISSPTFTGTVSGITKTMVGLSNVDNTSDVNKPVSTATQTALDAKLALAGGTMTGALTLSGTPTSDLHAATKLYVDGVASGINFHAAVKAATSTNISTTYSNGTNGYGATLTADANGAMGTVDGQTMSVGDRVLVKAQTDAKQNGIYVVTSLGGSSSKWIMTRAADDDNNPNGEVAGGDFCFVTSGTYAANTGFILSGSGTLTLGTDNLNYVQFNAAQAIIAGTGLSKTGGTILIDTATTADLSTAQTLSNKTFVAPVLGSATATSINGTIIPSSKTLVTTADSGTVTSTMIADETIVNADISASAAIAYSKLNLSSSITSSDIVDGTIVDADINASAAIAQSKISGLTSDLAAKAPLANPTFTGTVTVASAGIAFTDGTQTKEGVPSRTPIIQKTASYKLSQLTERDSLIEVASSSGTTITVPADSATNYPIGTSIDILQTSTGQVTVAGDTGVTVNATPGLKLRTQWSGATLFKRAANTWVLYGDLTA